MSLDSEAREIAIRHSLTIGDFDLAELLAPSGGNVLDYGVGCPRVDVIEDMLNGGYFRFDSKLAASTIPNLARSERWQLASNLLLLHSPLPQNHEDCILCWIRSLEETCIAGNLRALQWLMGHFVGVEAIERMTKENTIGRFLSAAARGGHVEVMAYLRACRLDGNVSAAVKHAVKWLLANYARNSCDTTLFHVTEQAAEFGHLTILKGLHELESARLANKVEECDDKGFSWWPPSRGLIYHAVKGGQIEVLKWLQANYPLTRGPDAMDVAASNGNLEVVKWLHRNGFKAGWSAIKCAAAKGHFDVVKWLHLKCDDDLERAVMYAAAEGGHLTVVKWLYDNFPETRTHRAIDAAVKNKHLRVVDWLVKHFPEYPVGSESLKYMPLVNTSDVGDFDNAFELLLWLHVHADYVFATVSLECTPIIARVRVASFCTGWTRTTNSFCNGRFRAVIVSVLEYLFREDKINSACSGAKERVQSDLTRSRHDSKARWR